MQKSLLFSLFLVTETLTFSLLAQKRPSQRPNILFCIADDASYPHFGANGSQWVNTPGFDRMAREGILFSNCYTPNAKSAPSRACVLTGLYSWQLKEAGNHIPQFPSDIKVVTEVLKENGYQIAFSGKGWAPGTAHTKEGEQRELTGTPFQKYTLIPPTPYIGKNDYTENFKDFLNRASEDKPWFFWMGFTEPHREYEYGSGEKFGGKSKEMIDKVPMYWPDNDVVRTDMLDYAFEIEYLDKHLAAIISELERRDLLDNTLIIFTSDNGMPFPRSKANSYEISNHMPLTIMWKNGIINPGRVVEDYINFVDFTPTFLEVSKTNPIKHGMIIPTGKSLTEIFKNKKAGIVTHSRNFTLLGRERHDYGRRGNQGYPTRGIIQDNLLYILNLKPDLLPAGESETGYLDCDGSPTKTTILNMKRSGQNNRYFQQSFGKREPEELYNLSLDKDCIINLIDNPTYSKQKERLKNKLFEQLRAQNDPRMFNNGNVFDSYPFSSENAWDFWERVVSGKIMEPWKQTNWVNPTDYESYK